MDVVKSTKINCQDSSKRKYLLNSDDHIMSISICQKELINIISRIIKS
jgi:hypothetical protein